MTSKEIEIIKNIAEATMALFEFAVDADDKWRLGYEKPMGMLQNSLTELKEMSPTTDQ